jgi:hypothetical protein
MLYLIGERNLPTVRQDCRMVGVNLIDAARAVPQHWRAQLLVRRVGRQDDQVAPRKTPPCKKEASAELG